MVCSICICCISLWRTTADVRMFVQQVVNTVSSVVCEATDAWQVVKTVSSVMCEATDVQQVVNTVSSVMCEATDVWQVVNTVSSVVWCTYLSLYKSLTVRLVSEEKDPFFLRLDPLLECMDYGEKRRHEHLTIVLRTYKKIVPHTIHIWATLKFAHIGPLQAQSSTHGRRFR